MAGEVDMNETIKTMQATTLGQMGINQTVLSDFQARVFLRLEAQLDPIDASVATQIANSGLPGQMAGLNAGAQTPGSNTKV